MEQKLNLSMQSKDEQKENKIDENENENNNNQFTNLLKEWNLSQYIEILIINEGYEEIIDCTDLSLDEFKQMGFKAGHAKKLKRKINDFMNANENNNNNEFGVEGRRHTFNI